MDTIVFFFTLVAAFFFGVSGVRMVVIYIDNKDMGVPYVEKKMVPWIFVFSVSLFWLIVSWAVPLTTVVPNG